MFFIQLIQRWGTLPVVTSLRATTAKAYLLLQQLLLTAAALGAKTEKQSRCTPESHRRILRHIKFVCCREHSAFATKGRVMEFISYNIFSSTLEKSAVSPTLVVTTAATLIVGAVYSYHWYLSYQRTGEAPVNWSWIPIMGSAIELGTKPLDFLSESAKKNKDIFGMVVAGNRMFIISDPHSQHVILRPPKTLSFVEFENMVMHNFFGSDFKKAGIPGVEALDEPLMRKWYSTYFLSNASLSKLTQRMQVQLNKDLGPNTSTQTVPLYDFLSRVIFQASVAALFNPTAGDDHALYDAFDKFDKHLPMAAGGYKVSYASVPRNARQILYDATIKYRDADNCEFMQKRYEYFDTFDQGSLNPSFQLAMLWVSVGNSMPATFWLIYYLLSHPRCLEKVRAEIQQACSPEELEGEVRQESLDKMIYLECCFTEALRLCSGSLIMRFVLEPTEITLASGKSYKFRKGDRVGLCPPIYHRDPEIYSEPSAFRPERWEAKPGSTPEEVTAASLGKIPQFKGGEKISGTAYMPFGGGYTYCPGRRFARNEVKTMVAFLLTRFELSLPNKDNESPPEVDGARAGLGIFPPKNDVDVHIRKL